MLLLFRIFWFDIFKIIFIYWYKPNIINKVMIWMTETKLSKKLLMPKPRPANNYFWEFIRLILNVFRVYDDVAHDFTRHGIQAIINITSFSSHFTNSCFSTYLINVTLLDLSSLAMSSTYNITSLFLDL